jgi:hypothetical protein
LTSFTILALGVGGLLDFGVFSALLHQSWRYSLAGTLLSGRWPQKKRSLERFV